VDDDCDGEVDEDFNLSSNPRHCGRCGHACRADNAEVGCQAGECTYGECFDGFADFDDAPDCEYRCPVFPTEAERCNGTDDDCDGTVDEQLPAPPSDLCRTTEGTPCADVTPVCETRNGTTTWFCDYPAAVEVDRDVPNGIELEETKCDGVDGDCDGIADEPYTELGDRCADGEVGACRDEGIVRCDPNDPTATFCDLSEPPDPVPGAPSQETCNGVDDNCDGIVDNSDPDDPDRIVDDMVHVTAGGMDFWIYRHEASRVDATQSSGGTKTLRACSKPNVIPWTRVSLQNARAACQEAGYRLCTEAEWQAACEGSSGSTYPYGEMYEPDACNGADYDAVPGGDIDNAVIPTAALPMCTSGPGALDLSGNVKEWTDDRRGTTDDGTPIYVVRGGSFESPRLGLTCQTDLSRATADSVLGGLGFRCCSDEAP
jgi:hypothetical protein